MHGGVAHIPNVGAHRLDRDHLRPRIAVGVVGVCTARGDVHQREREIASRNIRWQVSPSATGEQTENERVLEELARQSLGVGIVQQVPYALFQVSGTRLQPPFQAFAYRAANQADNDEDEHHADRNVENLRTQHGRGC